MAREITAGEITASLCARARANQDGDAIARAFEQSRVAYAWKDGTAAKGLSNEDTHIRERWRVWMLKRAHGYSAASILFLFSSPCLVLTHHRP
jgi:hypothetical protein